MPTPNTSDTPRVDSEEFSAKRTQEGYPFHCVLSNFARELERENKLWGNDNDRLKEMLAECNFKISSLIKERDQLKEEVSRRSKEVIMNTAFIETLIDPWKKEAEQWKACADNLYLIAKSWVPEHVKNNPKHNTAKVIAEFEKLRDGNSSQVKEREETMSLETKPGERVLVLFKDGEVMNGNNRDQRLIKELLKENGIYTVKSIQIASWVSLVELEEFPGTEFNTVCFKNINAEVVR